MIWNVINFILAHTHIQYAHVIYDIDNDDDHVEFYVNVMCVCLRLFRGLQNEMCSRQNGRMKMDTNSKGNITATEWINEVGEASTSTH
jgi:dynactin complex subunit